MHHWRLEPNTAAVGVGWLAGWHPRAPMLHSKALLRARDAVSGWLDQTAPAAGPLDQHAAVACQRPGTISHLIDVVEGHP